MPMRKSARLFPLSLGWLPLPNTVAADALNIFGFLPQNLRVNGGNILPAPLLILPVPPSACSPCSVPAPCQPRCRLGGVAHPLLARGHAQRSLPENGVFIFHVPPAFCAKAVLK